MNEFYDLPKAHAERIILRSLEISKSLDEQMYRELGMLAMGMAHLYNQVAEYEEAVKTVANLNVQLQTEIQSLREDNIAYQIAGDPRVLLAILELAISKILPESDTIDGNETS
jgi:hypothetical protein